MGEITGQELKDARNYHGDLISLRVFYAKDAPGELVLEIRTGGHKYVKCRHLVLTDAHQLLSELKSILGTLDPSPQDLILAELKEIRKLLEKWWLVMAAQPKDGGSPSSSKAERTASFRPAEAMPLKEFHLEEYETG